MPLHPSVRPINSIFMFSNLIGRIRQNFELSLSQLPRTSQSTHRQTRKHFCRCKIIIGRQSESLCRKVKNYLGSMEKMGSYKILDNRGQGLWLSWQSGRFRRKGPIKKIYSVNLRYSGSEHSDWLKNLSSQSECLKNQRSVKFKLKIFFGSGPEVCGSNPVIDKIYM